MKKKKLEKNSQKSGFSERDNTDILKDNTVTHNDAGASMW